MIYDEVQILRYVENDLTQKQKIAFEQKMQQDEELRSLVQSMKASILPYEAVMAEHENEKMPDSLYKFLDDVSRVANEEGQIKHGKKTNFARLALVASFATVLFLAGFLSNSLFYQAEDKVQNLLSEYQVPSELFESMVIYQALYSRKTVEAASQSAKDTSALLKEFNNKNSLALSVPDLTEHGYTFRRVQELAYKEKPILQFIYLDRSGEPVAVCVTPAKSDSVAQQQIPMQFADMNTVLWGHNGGAYMLISKEPQQKLDIMAASLMKQQSS